MPITETIRLGYSKPRAAITTDDTLVSAAADTMMLANVPDYSYKPNSQQNAVEVAWTMGADAQSCVAYLFAHKKNGDIVLVWTGTITAGTQESTDGRFYVDTFAATTDNWITTIKEVDGGGNNRMARIVLDTTGYYGFFSQFTGLSSESVQAIYSGF